LTNLPRSEKAAGTLVEKLPAMILPLKMALCPRSCNPGGTLKESATQRKFTIQSRVGGPEIAFWL